MHEDVVEQYSELSGEDEWQEIAKFEALKEKASKIQNFQKKKELQDHFKRQI